MNPDLLETVVTASPDSVALFDLEGRYLYCNAAGLAVMGRSGGLDEVVGRTPGELGLGDDFAACTEAEARQVRETGAIVHGEFRVTDAAAGPLPRVFDYVLAPVRGGDGQIVAVVRTSRDISERRQVEEELRLRDRAIAAANGGITIADPHQPDCPLIYHNPAFERITGYSSNEIRGRNCRFLQGPDSNENGAVDQIRAALAAEREACVVFKNYKKDGSSFWNELTLSPVRDADGRLTHILGIQSDISERVEAERQIAAQREKERRVTDSLQQALLLRPRPDAFDGMTVELIYQAALAEANVGGDFFDAFHLEDGEIALVVGDVSGKGLAAAVRTAEVKFALRAFLREYPHPARALSRLNDFVCNIRRLDDAEDTTFVALALAVLNTHSGETVFSLAGAEPPLVLRANASSDADENAKGPTSKVDLVTAYGLPLGILPHQEYDTQTLSLARGDLLLMTTDGITEARRPGGDLFGYERMQAIARQSMALGDLAATGKAILSAAQNFAGGSLHDDVCMLLASRK